MKIVYLPPIPYKGMKQRPQYLAEELAKEHEVVYIDPTVSMMKYLFKGGEKPTGYSYSVSENLHVIRLNGSYSVHRSIEALGRWVGLPEQIQLKKYLRDADMVWVGYAPWYDLVQGFPKKIVYDKMDDDSQITRNKLLRKVIAKTEARLTSRANYIFTTTQLFCDEFRAKGREPVLISNAVDRADALTPREPIYTKKAGVTVFGYVGMISHWFDFDAIRTILDANPNYEVILVGPLETEPFGHERLHYAGQVPKNQVCSWIASFDVCLYPFKQTKFLDTIDPVKIYEYLATNKPVLAAESVELRKFKDSVLLYKDIKMLREIVTTPSFSPPYGSEKERIRFIEDNCWNARGNDILHTLQYFGGK